MQNSFGFKSVKKSTNLTYQIKVIGLLKQWQFKLLPCDYNIDYRFFHDELQNISYSSLINNYFFSFLSFIFLKNVYLSSTKYCILYYSDKAACVIL